MELSQNIVHHAAFAGMVGAILKALYWLQFQTSRGLLRPRWFVSFIVTPFIGAILGWLISLVVRVVVHVVAGSSATTDWKTISLLALFAGFKWEWALGWFEEAAKSVQSRIQEKAPTKVK